MVMVFYDVYGNEVSPETLLNSFIEEYTGDATDFEDGSQIKNLFNSFALLGYDIEEQLNDILTQINVDTADGEYLDTIAEQPQLNLTRNEGTGSTGTVIFTLDEVKTEDYIVPEGTSLVCDEYEFETTADCVVPAGLTSEEVIVESLDVGTEYNIPAHSIMLPDDGVYDYTVDNPYKFTGGTDYEEDEAFRNRILEQSQITDYGSRPYYINRLSKEFEEMVHDIYITDCDCDYTGIVIPNTYLEDTQAVLNQRVQTYMDNPSNILIGQSFVVNSPTVQEYDFKIYHGGETVIDSSAQDYAILINNETSEYDERIKKIIETYITGGTVEGLGTPAIFRGLNVNQEFNFNDIYSVLETIGVEVKDFLYTPTGELPERASIIPLNGKNKYNVEFAEDD